MHKKRFTFLVGLAAITISSLIPIAAQQKGAPPSDARPSQSHDSKQPTEIEHSERNQTKSGDVYITTSVAAEKDAKPKGTSAQSGPDINWNRVLAIVGIGGLFLAGRSLGALREQTSATSRSADATRASADASKGDTEIAKQALATNQEIERGYIGVGYSTLRFIDRHRPMLARRITNDDNPDTFETVIEITNIGRTPCTIYGGWVGFLYRGVSDLPDGEPKLLPAMNASTRLSRLFMVPSATGIEPMTFALQCPLTKVDIECLRTGDCPSNVPVPEAERIKGKHLWLVAEVDYCDRFEHFHRRGYATRWDRRADRFLLDPSVSRLNYDRRLTEEERKQVKARAGES